MQSGASQKGLFKTIAGPAEFPQKVILIMVKTWLAIKCSTASCFFRPARIVCSAWLQPQHTSIWIVVRTT